MQKFITKARALFSLKVLVPLLIISLAAVGAYATVKSAPKAKKRRPAAIRPTVEVREIGMNNHRVWVPVMGTVSAAREITLEARVSGEVESVSPTFIPGGFFEKGEEILTISPEDYELALSEVRSEVTTAEYNLKVELGYQKVSAREWDLLKGSAKGTDSEADLALRKPHLEKAKAEVRAAKAKLKQAQLDLERTHIIAPFAAMVEEKGTDIGATISLQEALATLVGTDEFWITVSIPVDRLDWIDIPVNGQTDGAVARIVTGSGSSKSERIGKVIRLLPSLESEGRMARVLISVKDPLNLEGKPGVKPLLLGSYVSVQIDGGTLSDVYAIPRNAYRDNNTIWVLGPDNTLEIRTMNPIWRDDATIVFDDGLAAGERLVISDISAPLQGMELRTMSEATKAKPAPGTMKKRNGQGGKGGQEVNNG